jgi:uncharacterized protein
VRDTPIEILVNKKVELERILGKHNAMLIAFSGGVDSTFLLAVATQVLKENVVAVTYAFPFHSNREIEEAIALGEMLGVTHRIINAKDLGPKKLTANLKDRCYHCKKQMGTALSTIAAEFNIKAIAHGANLDDEKDYRPGARAAEELGWIAPLAKAGLNKADIRALSKKMGLPTWNKPAMACLATRIPYGTPITKEALEMIDSAEAVLLSLGFSTCRVRHHGDVARIEVPSDEFSLFVKESLREDVTRKFRDIGFQHISLDLEGYVQGSMNRGIKIG